MSNALGGQHAHGPVIFFRFGQGHDFSRFLRKPARQLLEIPEFLDLRGILQPRSEIFAKKHLLLGIFLLFWAGNFPFLPLEKCPFFPNSRIPTKKKSLTWSHVGHLHRWTEPGEVGRHSTINRCHNSMASLPSLRESRLSTNPTPPTLPTHLTPRWPACAASAIDPAGMHQNPIPSTIPTHPTPHWAACLP